MIIGKNIETGEDVEINLEKLISTRAVITASSGGGKSWAIRRLLQESFGKVQQVILDWEGEYSNLRPQFDYMIVGDNGEIPIEVKTAEVLAKKIMQLKVSTIIDLSDLSRHDRIMFVKKFLDSLLNLPKELYDHLVMLIIDEAHQLCPQKGNAESMNPVIDVMSLGRKRGIGGVLCTQRIAKLNKDAVAEARNGSMGGMGLLEDRKRACDEMGFNTKSLEQSIKQLEPGEMYMYGSAISKEVIKVMVGDIKVKPPKIGEKGLVSLSKTPSAIAEILKGVTDLPKEAEKELREKQDFLNKIHQLKIQVRTLENQKVKPQVDENRLNQVAEQNYKKGFVDSERDWKKAALDNERKYQGHTAMLEKAIKEYQRKGYKIIEILGGENQEIPKLSLEPIKFESHFKPQPHINKPIMPEIQKPVTQVIHQSNSVKPTFPVEEFEEGEVNLSPAYMRLLRNTASFYPDSITKAKLAILSDVPLKASTFRNGLSKLKTLGFIQVSNGAVKCNESGIEKAGDFPQIPSDQDELVNMWCSKLSPAYEKMFRFAVQNYPNSVSKEELSEGSEVPIDASTFRNGLSKIKTLGLIKVEGGQITASSELFE